MYEIILFLYTMTINPWIAQIELFTQFSHHFRVLLEHTDKFLKYYLIFFVVQERLLDF